MVKLKKMDYDGEGTIYEVVEGKKYKLVLSMGKDPKTGKYPRRSEMFDGTFTQAKKRMEAMHAERALLKDIAELGLDIDDLTHYGLTEKVIFSRWKSALEVEAELSRRKAAELAMIAAYEAEEAARLAAEKHDPTYAEVSDEMLSEIEKHGRNRKSGEPLTNKTKNDYRITEKHIVGGHLGEMAVVEIEESDILRAIEELREAGKGDVTVHKAFSQIRRVLEYARKRKRLIAFNPIDGLEDSLKPVKPASERKGISQVEWARLIRLVLEGEQSGGMCAILFAACNGLRIGECLGITWECVFLDTPIPYLLIKQQHTAMDGLHKTKAKEGHKTPLDSAVVDYLRKWKIKQTAQLNELGIERGNDTPVCANAVGGILDTHNFENWWRAWSVAHGFGRFVNEKGRHVIELVVGMDDPSLYPECIIEWRDLENWPCDAEGRRYSRTYKRPKVKKHYEGVTPHVLRHTLFTLKAADTEHPISLKELQYLGGWSSPRMPLEVYLHHSEERALQSGGMVDRMLSNGVKQSNTA